MIEQKDFLANILECKDCIEQHVAYENYHSKGEITLEEQIAEIKQNMYDYKQFVYDIGEEQILKMIELAFNNLVSVKTERFEYEINEFTTRYIPTWKEGYRDAENIKDVLAKVVLNMLGMPHDNEKATYVEYSLMNHVWNLQLRADEAKKNNQ